MTEQQKADYELIKKGRKIAKWLGCGYRVVGAGPGLLLSSSEHPRYPIDLPEELVDSLVRKIS